MLAHDGDVTKNRIGPARSSCAIHVGSYNANRESIYVQQQTISGEGLSGIAFSTNVPHTVRGGPPVVRDGPDKGRAMTPGAYLPGHSDTKMCTDCHLSKNDDNNAIMAQLLMQGTNYVNFIGRYCWVAAGEHGMAAVVVTERDEPQAVIGSSLHKLAYPDQFGEHQERGRRLEHAHEHSGGDVSERHLHPEILSSRPGASISTRPAARRGCGSSTLRSSITRASPSESSRPPSRPWGSVSSSAPSTPRRSPLRRPLLPTRPAPTSPRTASKPFPLFTHTFM